MGFYIRDLERMARFYKDVLCFFGTDQGDLRQVQLVFLNRDLPYRLCTSKPTTERVCWLNSTPIR